MCNDELNDQLVLKVAIQVTSTNNSSLIGNIYTKVNHYYNLCDLSKKVSLISMNNSNNVKFSLSVTLFCLYRHVLFCSFSVSSKLIKSRYLVQFRDIFPQFRWNEFMELYLHTLSSSKEFSKYQHLYLMKEYLDIDTIIHDSNLAVATSSSSSSFSSLLNTLNLPPSSEQKESVLNPSDYMSSVCVYVNFPNEEFARQVAIKSGLIRR